MATAETVKATFRAFDTNGNGTISKKELAIVFSSDGMGWTQEQVEHLFEVADLDKDGSLSYEEFVDWIMMSGQHDGSNLAALFAKIVASVPERLQDNAASELIATDEDMLLLLQFQMLSLLGSESWHVLEQNEAFIKSKEQLEVFLSSGQCSISNSETPSNVSERWATAVGIFNRIVEHDEAAQSGARLQLAVATALTFSTPIKCFATKEPPFDGPYFDPINRYDAFCRWSDEGCLVSTFQDLTAWQLRYVVGSWCMEEELEWARAHCPADKSSRDQIGEAVHGMVEYKTHNNQGVSIHAGHELYYKSKPVTLETIHEFGGVCGNISKFGTGMSQAFGIPAMPVGQPGHCAFLWQKGPGMWTISNDISGWSQSTKHDSIQMTWGKHAWLIPLMECAQMNVVNYSMSERLRVAASVVPADVRADVLAKAAEICPFNMAVWQARVEQLWLDFEAGRDSNHAAWLSAVKDDLQLDAHEVVLSMGKPVQTSDPEREHDNHKLVDCSASEWMSKQESAWVEVDLGQACRVTKVAIQWWGISVAKSFRLCSTHDQSDQLEAEYIQQRDQTDADQIPDGYNGWSEMSGWDEPTSKVRLEMEDGCEDPWGFQVWLGIRQFNIHGTYCEAPTTAAGLLKMAASRRLSMETAKVDTGVRAADAGERKASLMSPLNCAISHIHKLIEETTARIEERRGLRNVEDLTLQLQGSSAGVIRVSSEEDRANNLVDGTDSEWWTGDEAAWIILDFQEPCTITSVKIRWWGYSVAKSFKIETSAGNDWVQQRSEADAKSDGEGCNGWVELKGWDAATHWLKITLEDGQLDPWGLNKLFGIRNVCVFGCRGHTDFANE